VVFAILEIVGAFSLPFEQLVSPRRRPDPSSARRRQSSRHAPRPELIVHPATKADSEAIVDLLRLVGGVATVAGVPRTSPPGSALVDAMRALAVRAGATDVEAISGVEIRGRERPSGRWGCGASGGRSVVEASLQASVGGAII